MLLRKTAWFWKSGLAVISFVLMFSISGCSDTPPEEDTVSETVIDVQDVSEEEQENEEEIINICIDLYDKAAEENKLDDLEIIRSIVNRLGENEYPAVDSRNQVNMTEAEQVLEFCEKVDTKEEADITILEVGYLGGFVKYDLHTKDGNVDVVRSYYGYENGEIQKEVTGRYQAEYWNYTEEGYLMFSGVWFSEELYVLTLSGAEEHTALRVQPLDETYRELSRKYLLPISFEQNNMFIVDWSEEDFGDLNFYDMYDILYPKVNGQYVPYVADDNLSVSAVYRIPKEEFESVIMKYFNIDSETLQSKTVYDSEDSTYEYKPRGFEEVEYPEYPYSEVIGYTENSDGTITLTAKEILTSIRKAVDASMQLRSKKELIEAFINRVNVDTQVTTDWRRFVLTQEENDLAKIIMAEKLKPEETRKFVSNAFRDGVLKTTGTEINKLMPPVSRFGGSGRAKKKQGVIEKLKAFFEKYFGLGITEMQSEKEEN